MTVKLNTGYECPLVGLGTYKIVGDEVLPVLDAALTAGYRLFDTAKVYNNEKEIGNAFELLLPKHHLKREDIFITTKLHPNTEENVNKMVNESLENLKTNYIDMYLIHYPKSFDYSDEDPTNKILRIASWNALCESKDERKIRSVGVSSYEIRHLEELRELGKVRETLSNSIKNNFPPCCNQVEYHPHFCRVELKNYCSSNNIFFQVSDTRILLYQNVSQAFSSLARHNEGLLSSAIITELSEKYDVPKTTILLSWATSQCVGVIPKSTNPSRLSQNLKTVQLEEKEVLKISELNLNQHYVRTTGWLVL
ncbi:hypothetical protein CRE_27248 [Caenorhabditis remanei]|uniref:NADP-dependent oxidoreductase domain-containing protein n=1 Tax=Caenorhabditis remanei TaxID=31234 RepID=E3LP98_CAERE|nr:hypothetical protein CRE_27248 [Caenorhabditis remanei]